MLGDFLNNLFNRPSAGGSPSAAVPEIDATSGALAAAVVIAALLLAWELRRRQG